MATTMTRTIAQQITAFGLIEPEFTNWYPKGGLPPGLKKVLDNLPVAQLDIPTLDEDFYTRRLKDKQLACKGAHRPCHSEQHACQTCMRAKKAFETLQELISDKLFDRIFPRGLIQAVMLALAGHDYGHPGAAWTSDARPELLLPMPHGLSGKHSDYSLEFLTSWWNDEIDERDSMPIAFRAIAVLMTWASSNGGHTKHGKRLEVDTVRPQSFLSWLMRAVDVTFSDDFVANTHFEVQLMWTESLGFQPETLRELIANREGFLRHVESVYSEFDKATRQLLLMAGVLCIQDFSITRETGWRSNLESAKKSLEQLKADDPEVLATVLTALEVNGITLTA